MRTFWLMIEFLANEAGGSHSGSIRFSSEARFVGWCKVVIKSDLESKSKSVILPFLTYKSKSVCQASPDL